MVRISAFRYVLGLTALGLAACGSAEQPQADGRDSNVTVPGQPAEAGKDGFVKLPPQEFVDRASASDLFEIEAARIAMDKAASGEVREFASMLLHDHDEAQAQLKTAVGAAGMQLHYAPKLTADQESQLEALRKAGDDFDAVYLHQQTGAHEEALAMLHGYAQAGEAQPLREHAQTASESVAKHLNRAQQLARANGETR